MTTDQAANAAAYAAIVQVIVSGIQIVIAIVAIRIAGKEIGKWRTELLGSGKIELAVKMGKTVRALKEAFWDMRNANALFGHAPEYSPNSTHDEQYKQDQQYEYDQRLAEILRKLEPLYEIRWEMSIRFDDDEGIEEQVKVYNAKFTELRNAMKLVFDGNGGVRENTIVYRGFDGTDKFTEEIETATNRLLDIARKYGREGKVKTKPGS